jgi:hypothetical protein
LPADEKKPEVEPSKHIEEVQELSLEQIHIVASLKNTLTWGEKQIPMNRLMRSSIYKQSLMTERGNPL